MPQADLIVCRAGASTVTEIAAVGAAALFVPFPSAVDDHQTTNARFLVDAGGGWLVQQTELTPEWLARMLTDMTERPALLERALKAKSDAKDRGHAREVVPRLRGACRMKHAIRHIHFVGMGGSGMSGIAEVLLNLGYRISGSDLADSATLRRLAGLGIATCVGHDGGEHRRRRRGGHVDRGARRQPRGAGRAREEDPVVPRALMLAELMRLKQGIAIAGTHGKTTTTSLVASVLAAGRAGPDLRHRRAPEQRRRQCASWAAATTSWSRPTSRTRRS